MQKVESGPQISEVQVVDFKMGNEEYAIEISHIIEIISYKNPTVVPKAPDFIEGVVDLRGKVIPVIDLTKRLGIVLDSNQKANHILILKIRNFIIGVSVEKVLEVTHIAVEKIQKAQEFLTRGDVKFLKGFCKIDGRLVLLLDVPRLLSEQEKELLNI